MKILAIETSCDDTSSAIIDDEYKVLANIVQSQIKIHSKYYGIVPELASRHHLENINSIIDCVLSEAGLKFNDIDAFAVTQGPGLAGSLIVGNMTAKTFSYIFNKPLVPVNHLKAHVWANFVHEDQSSFKPEFPAVIMLASGGHTELLLMRSLENIEVLGKTRDDAVGEAFDKVAKLLDLGFPGGPVIDKLSKEIHERIDMPRALLPNTYDFSYSGLKTAVLYKIKENDNLTEKNKHILASSFQDVAIDVLVRKIKQAAKEFNAKSIMLSGGVAANSSLREKVKSVAEKLHIKYHYPPLKFCTDNAAMVGALAAYEISIKGVEYFKNTNVINAPDFFHIYSNNKNSIKI